MARYPGATWRPVSGHTDGPMRSHLGAVLHVNESNGNLWNWVAGDHNMSCHFEVYKTGEVEQYIDTDLTSWCQMDGNRDYVSIESEGYHGEPYTNAQLGALVNLLVWLHETHGLALREANAPGQPGIGWHGMGGAAWGGHTDCPGDARKGARPYLIRSARRALGLPHGSLVGGADLPPIAPTPAAGSTGPDGSAHHHLRGPAAAAPVAPDGYPWHLFAVHPRTPHERGTVYAAAPGAWREVDAAALRALIRTGLTSGTVRLVYPATLRKLRRLYTGK